MAVLAGGWAVRVTSVYQGGSRIAVHMCYHTNQIVSKNLNWQVQTICEDLPPINLKIVDDTDGARERRSMHEEVLAIEALPFLSKLSQTSDSKRAGFRASLSCCAGIEHEACGKKVALNPYLLLRKKVTHVKTIQISFLSVCPLCT